MEILIELFKLECREENSQGRKQGETGYCTPVCISHIPCVDSGVITTLNWLLGFKVLTITHPGMEGENGGCNHCSTSFTR